MWNLHEHSYSLHDGVLNRVYHQQPNTRLFRWCCRLCLDKPTNMALMGKTLTLHTRMVADVCSATQGWQPAALPVPRSTAGRAACCKRMPCTPAALSTRSSLPRDAVETLDLPPPPPPLKPVPIIHTTAYLQQTQQLVVSPDAGSRLLFGLKLVDDFMLATARLWHATRHAVCTPAAMSRP